jgi:CheY-like chemotaxis protein
MSEGTTPGDSASSAARTGARGLPRGESAAAILIVDDNAAKRLSMNSVLGSLDCTIIEAESGEAGLREVMKRILMDVQMPAMDGYETAGSELRRAG